MRIGDLLIFITADAGFDGTTARQLRQRALPSHFHWPMEAFGDAPESGESIEQLRAKRQESNYKLISMDLSLAASSRKYLENR